MAFLVRNGLLGMQGIVVTYIVAAFLPVEDFLFPQQVTPYLHLTECTECISFVEQSYSVTILAMFHLNIVSLKMWSFLADWRAHYVINFLAKKLLETFIFVLSFWNTRETRGKQILCQHDV